MGERIDAVELGDFDQRHETRPMLRATVASREPGVLSRQRLRSDRPLDRLRVKLDATVVNEADQPGQ